MRVKKFHLHILIVILLCTVLASCSNKTVTYEIPVFDIPEEVFTTWEVKNQNVSDWIKVYLKFASNPSNGIASVTYTEFEQCTILINEPGTFVKEGDVLAVITDKELENDLRLKQENLELIQLLYNDYYRKYLDTGEGYYDMQIALSDMEFAQHEYDKAVEKMETLKLISPTDFWLTNISPTYLTEKDPFNNQYKIHTVRFNGNPDNYHANMRIDNNGYSFFQKLGLKTGDTIQVKDKDDKPHTMSITSIHTLKDSRNPGAISGADVYLDFVKEEGVDYNNIVKYGVYYELALNNYDDVIAIPKKYVYSTSDNGFYTYVLENNIKVIRNLIIGTEVLNKTAYLVLSGLKENELVITGSSFK